MKATLCRFPTLKMHLQHAVTFELTCDGGQPAPSPVSQQSLACLVPDSHCGRLPSTDLGKRSSSSSSSKNRWAGLLLLIVCNAVFDGRVRSRLFWPLLGAVKAEWKCTVHSTNGSGFGFKRLSWRKQPTPLRSCVFIDALKAFNRINYNELFY